MHERRVRLCERLQHHRALRRFEQAAAYQARGLGPLTVAQPVMLRRMNTPAAYSVRYVSSSVPKATKHTTQIPTSSQAGRQAGRHVVAVPKAEARVLDPWVAASERRPVGQNDGSLGRSGADLDVASGAWKLQ